MTLTLTIRIWCLVFLLLQDVDHGGSVHGLSNRDTHSPGDGFQGQLEGQWLESSRDLHPAPKHGFRSSLILTDLSDAEVSPSERAKRSTYSKPDKVWPHDIPVVITNNYTGSVDRLHRVMKYLSDQVCVRFHDVTSTYDKKNPKWFTSNGFKTNSYVRITTESGCSASMGDLTKWGAKALKPCDKFSSNLHEFFHVLGVGHEQASRGRDSHISVQLNNVLKSKQWLYTETTDPSVLVYNFNPISEMLYSDYGFNGNGLETYNFIRDDADWYDFPLSRHNNLFYELNQVYRCNELFCNNNQTDCRPGYFALVYGVCRCVCPDDLDPVTNCQELINQPTRVVSWPETPMALLGANSCPQGFDQNVGILPVTGLSKPHQEPVPIPIPTTNNTLELPICTKTSPERPADVDWLSWPPGGYYCIIKPKGVNCGGPFKEGSLELHTTQGGGGPVGNVGDSKVYDDMLVIRFCCQNVDYPDMKLDLPNAEPFRLIGNNSCPLVRGMAVTKGAVNIYTNKVVASGALPPKHSVKASNMVLYQCVYIPPVYGCNMVITLNSTKPSVQITTPGFDTAREPNRRCFYAFNNPKNSRLMLTFNTFDLHTNDKFHVKRYNPLQDEYRIKNSKFPKQIVSVYDYLSLEYWSSWEVTKHKGLQFTVDVILEEDFCYNLTRKGEDYVGDKSVAETFEDCIPWEKATSCDDFPFDDILSLLSSGNKCRNPNGKLDQPWCYTYVGETECYKRYCDVCNLKSPVDALPGCSTLIKADPALCTTSMQRFGCFLSCGLSQQPYVSDGCPSGWRSYGSRCFKLFTSQLTYKEANKKCESIKSSGTLFHIKDLDDQVMIMDVTDAEKDKNLHTSWISGQSDPRSKKWVFSNTDLPVTYSNFSKKNAKIRKTRQCIQLSVTRGQVKGYWKNRNCDGSDKASYICQFDRSLPDPDYISDDPCHDDDVAACESALAVFPTFCSDNRSMNASAGHCFKSCGQCTDNIQCVQPLSKTYHRISSEWAVKSGQVMTFGCKEDLYHVGGDLQRACSSFGNFLGKEPVCSDQPVPRDIKLETLRRRRSTLSKKIAYLMDHEGYRIPFNGKITKWYYYCTKKGTLVFFVYRQQGNNYNYVNSNTISCIPGWRMSFNVPAAEQISVKKGDVFGVYSQSSGTLSINKCESSAEKLLIVRTASARSFNNLVKSNQTFSTQYCMIPSLGLRLEP